LRGNDDAPTPSDPYVSASIGVIVVCVSSLTSRNLQRVRKLRFHNATGASFERGDRLPDRVPVVEIGVVALDRVIKLLGCLGHVFGIELTGLTAQLTPMLTDDSINICVDAGAQREFTTAPFTAHISSGLWRAPDRQKRCR
jgi:hypothetical protein